MHKIKWGIIGCGKVSELKSGPAFNKVENSQLVAVMRRDATLAEDYAKRHGVPKFYTDADALINDEEVNAVYVATPPDTHALYAIKAMRAGKAVYVEKPMARTYAECLEMIQVSEETGQPLYVAYYRRSLAAFVKVKQLVDEGVIGKPLTVNIRLHKAKGERDQFQEQQSWHLNPEIAGAGYFYDLGSHQLDYMDFLFGPITNSYGMASNIVGYYQVEDTVAAVFTFASGVKGTGSWCFVVDKDNEEDMIEITGTKGKISFPCFEKGDVVVTTHNNKEVLSFENHENISYYLIQQVVGALRGEGECVSTMHSAARTNFVMEEIVKPFYSQKPNGL